MNLELLSLGQNALTGPVALGRLVDLETVSLGRNTMTGPVPASLVNLAPVEAVPWHETDPDDRWMVAAALDGAADVLVTGDRWCNRPPSLPPSRPAGRRSP